MNILLPKVEHILWNLVSMSIKEKNLDFKNTRKKKYNQGKKKKRVFDFHWYFFKVEVLHLQINFPTTKGNFWVAIINVFCLGVEGLNVFDLDLEWPVLFLGDLTIEVKGAGFLFLESEFVSLASPNIYNINVFQWAIKKNIFTLFTTFVFNQ